MSVSSGGTVLEEGMLRHLRFRLSTPSLAWDKNMYMTIYHLHHHHSPSCIIAPLIILVGCGHWSRNPAVISKPTKYTLEFCTCAAWGYYCSFSRLWGWIAASETQGCRHGLAIVPLCRGTGAPFDEHRRPLGPSKFFDGCVAEKNYIIAVAPCLRPWSWWLLSFLS